MDLALPCIPSLQSRHHAGAFGLFAFQESAQLLAEQPPSPIPAGALPCRVHIFDFAIRPGKQNAFAGIFDYGFQSLALSYNFAGALGDQLFQAGCLPLQILVQTRIL